MPVQERHVPGRRQRHADDGGSSGAVRREARAVRRSGTPSPARRPQRITATLRNTHGIHARTAPARDRRRRDGDTAACRSAEPGAEGGRPACLRPRVPPGTPRRRAASRRGRTAPARRARRGRRRCRRAPGRRSCSRRTARSANDAAAHEHGRPHAAKPAPAAHRHDEPRRHDQRHERQLAAGHRARA